MKGLKISKKTDKQETLKKRNRRNIPEEESTEFHGSLNRVWSRIWNQRLPILCPSELLAHQWKRGLQNKKHMKKNRFGSYSKELSLVESEAPQGFSRLTANQWNRSPDLWRELETRDIELELTLMQKMKSQKWREKL